MTLASDIKTALETDLSLMSLLTGGIHVGIEEINRQSAPGAFDGNNEIQPCALIKVPLEVPAGPYVSSVRTTVTIYFYQRQGYAVIDQAMSLVFADLNEKQIGVRVWNLQYENGVYQQRDQALDCPLGTLRFTAVRRL